MSRWVAAVRRWGERGRWAKPERLVVGLGNPGPQYLQTRHNVGFDVADRIASAGAGWTPAAYRAEEWLGEQGGRTLAVIKPQTFVNASGDAVLASLRRFDLKPDRLIVVHDDIDLELGQLRVRLGGSSGGHLGVHSVSDAVRTDAYLRIRIGVGRPPAGVDPAVYVLDSFPDHERQRVDVTVERAAEAVHVLLQDDIDSVMREFNRRDASDRDPSRA